MIEREDDFSVNLIYMVLGFGGECEGGKIRSDFVEGFDAVNFPLVKRLDFQTFYLSKFFFKKLGFITAAQITNTQRSTSLEPPSKAV